MREGAREYLKQPFSLDDVVDAVLRQLGIQGAGGSEASIAMIGESDPIRVARECARQVGGTDSSVLITGETGTGKELMAAMLHDFSRRAGRGFVCINCAAIPDSLLESELFGTERGAFTGAHQAREGLLRAANGGTVFLDEIGELSLYAQAKLLRVLESRQIVRLGATRGLPLDIRVISATNRDLDSLMTTGQFRKDLFFRLNVVRMHLPSLRERKEDIPALCHHYIGEFNRQFRRRVTRLDDQALQHLLRHDWPGNVRELKNVLEAVFAGGPGDTISPQDLPEDFRRRLKNVKSTSDSERDRLLEALASTEWNRSKAAEKLNWSRMTLYRKMDKYRLRAVNVERRPLRERVPNGPAK
jgi:DNA-binding NtrC family response regulator